MNTNHRIQWRAFFFLSLTFSVLVSSFQNCSGGGGMSASNATTEASPTGSQSGPANYFKSFASHSQAMCGVKADKLFCWGAVVPGAGAEQRGTDLTYTSRPFEILSSGVQKVVAGQSHFCALVSGEVFCWGANSNGQIGDGTTDTRAIPVKVFGVGVTDISASDNQTCVVKNGDLFCWGAVYSYPLMSEPNQLTPQLVVLSKKVKKVDLGSYGSICAIFEDTSLACWGYNDKGQLGDGLRVGRTQPYEVFQKGVSEIQIDSGWACAIKDQDLYCWGISYLGDGVTTTNSSGNPRLPTKILSGPLSGLSISQGSGCVIKNGDVFCWGYNKDGRLGIGTWEDALVPTLVMASGVRTVHARGDQEASCLSRETEAYCWGDSRKGRMGPGYQAYVYQPKLVPALSGIADIQFGQNFHGCGTKNDKVYCWGYGAATGSGNPYQQQSKQVYEVLSGGISQVQAAQNMSCALQNGDIYCWGDNLNRLVPAPAPANKSLPRKVMSGPIDSYSVRFDSLCAVKSGQVYCIGTNDRGQLGRSTTGTSDFSENIATNVPGVVHAIAQHHSGVVCALSDQGMYCWGDRNPSIQTSPVQESNMLFDRVSIGYNYICAENSQGLYCKGNIPGGGSAATMTLVNTGVSDKFITLKNRLCFKKGSQVSCRGERVFGGVNPWTFPLLSSFENVFTDSVDDIYAGDWELTSGHSFCIRKGAENWCWGNNDYDQLGFSSKQINAPQKLSITW